MSNVQATTQFISDADGYLDNLLTNATTLSNHIMKYEQAVENVKRDLAYQDHYREIAYKLAKENKELTELESKKLRNALKTQKRIIHMKNDESLRYNAFLYFFTVLTVILLAFVAVNYIFTGRLQQILNTIIIAIGAYLTVTMLYDIYTRSNTDFTKYDFEYSMKVGDDSGKLNAQVEISTPTICPAAASE